MQSFLDKIGKLRFGWNERTLAESDFERICSRLKIASRWLPLSVDGFYTCNRRKHYIAINNKLAGGQQAVFVMFHELGHYLMHAPSNEPVSFYCGSKTNNRDESEADAFAYCALLPLALMRSRPDEELAEMYGTQFFLERLRVYERYGI